METELLTTSNFKTVTMDESEYEASFLLENDYWWFKGQRAIILDQLSHCTPLWQTNHL